MAKKVKAAIGWEINKIISVISRLWVRLETFLLLKHKKNTILI